MIVECRSDRNYEAALAKMVEGRADAMIVGLFSLPNLGKVVQLAALHKLPTIYPYGSFVRAGGLMSYGASLADLRRQVGVYTGGVLKGEKPADLPVLQATKSEFVVNLQAARTIGIEVPPSLLALADEVIE